jgi:hypothetical protein
VKWARVAGQAGDKIGSSQYSDRSSAVSDDVLASALEDLEAGLTPLQVLDRYPSHEAEIAELLQVAYELRTSRWPAMSMAGRVRGRERMQAALAGQKRRGSGFLSPLWLQVGVGLTLMLMAGVAFLASPYSPLGFPSKGAAVTPTLGAPALAAPTATFTPLPPSPSATASPTETASATPRPVRSVEPTETGERLVLADRTRVLTPTPTAQLTATRRATRANTVTPMPTPAATVTPLATGQGAVPAPPTEVPATLAPPPPTVEPPTSTPSPAPPEPSPTRTMRPTPTWTVALATPTETRQPSPTVQPSSTARLTETPEPTETTWPPRPRLSQTPDPTRTPRRTGAADLPVLIKVNDQRLQSGGQLPPVLPLAAGNRPRRP